MTRVLPLLLLSATLLLPATPAGAVIATSADPIYHGVLRIRPAVGTIDRSTGNAVVKVSRWVLLIDPELSDGIYPAQEPIIVAIGAESFYLEAGKMKASRNGKRFTYRARVPKGARDIKSLSIRQQRDGSYSVSYTLVGVDLSRLLFEDPACMATAIIIGSDDGFTGVAITSPSFSSRRLRLPEECSAQAWPWA